MAKPKIYKVQTTEGNHHYVRALTSTAARLHVARSVIDSAEMVEPDELLNMDKSEVVDAVPDGKSNAGRPPQNNQAA